MIRTRKCAVLVSSSPTSSLRTKPVVMMTSYSTSASSPGNSYPRSSKSISDTKSRASLPYESKGIESKSSLMSPESGASAE